MILSLNFYFLISNDIHDNNDDSLNNNDDDNKNNNNNNNNNNDNDNNNNNNSDNNNDNNRDNNDDNNNDYNNNNDNNNNNNNEDNNNKDNNNKDNNNSNIYNKLLFHCFVCVVLDVPGPPRNLKAKDVTKKGCVLTWDVPKSDGGAQIQGYILEKLQSFSNKWMRVTKDLITDTTYKIRDVDEGEEYEFRVSAENEAGVGKPSEPCGVVIKDPFGEWLFGYLTNVISKSLSEIIYQI